MDVVKNRDISVLVCEDDDASLILITSYLKIYFSNIHIARNGQEGIEIFMREKPDIIFSDIGMPLINGIQMSEKIRQFDKNVKIILITAFDDPILIVNALRLGLNNYLFKPIDRVKITTAIEQIIQTVNTEKTVKKQQETINTLTTAFTKLSNFIFITNAEGWIEFVNPFAVSFFNIDEVNLNQENIFEKVFNKDDFYQNNIKNGFRSKQEFNFEYNVDYCNEILWFKVICLPILKNEEIDKLLFNFENITRIKESEEILKKINVDLEQKVADRTWMLEETNAMLELELTKRVEFEKELIKSKEIAEQARDMAEKANEAKSIFLAKVSHELRTPLNGILGLSSILVDKVAENQKHSIFMIKKSGENLLAIINDILDVSKIESGKFSLNIEVFNIFETIDNVVSILQTIAFEKSLELSYSIEEDIPKFLLGDSLRLSQALINVINNSIKFTNKGYIKVQIYLKEILNNEAEIQFSILDTGIGIPQDKIELIFESFQQVEPTLTRKYGGTGLGLTITKEIIDLMKGNIVVNSIVNHGTEFKINLKFPISNNLKETANFDRKNSILNEKLKILIVDDSEINRLVFKDLIANYKYELTLASNGEEAFELANNNYYDLIFMDIQMPDICGLDITKKIRVNSSLNSHTNIVAFSAFSSEPDKLNAYYSGFDYFLQKPIKKETFEKFLENIKLVNDTYYLVNFRLRDLYWTINQNKATLKNIIDYFIMNSIQNIENLKLLIDEENSDKILQLTHKVKTEYLNFSMFKSYELLKKIENNIKDNNYDDIYSLINILLIEIQKNNIILKEIENENIMNFLIRSENEVFSS